MDNLVKESSESPEWLTSFFHYFVKEIKDKIQTSITCTLWSFQNDGSSRNSKLCDDGGRGPFSAVVQSSKSPMLRIADVAALEWPGFSLATDLVRRSGGLRTDNNDTESEEEVRLWKPKRLFIALAVSEMNGILELAVSF